MECSPHIPSSPARLPVRFILHRQDATAHRPASGDFDHRQAGSVDARTPPPSASQLIDGPVKISLGFFIEYPGSFSRNRSLYFRMPCSQPLKVCTMESGSSTISCCPRCQHRTEWQGIRRQFTCGGHYASLSDRVARNPLRVDPTNRRPEQSSGLHPLRTCEKPLRIREAATGLSGSCTRPPRNRTWVRRQASGRRERC